MKSCELVRAAVGIVLVLYLPSADSMDTPGGCWCSNGAAPSPVRSGFDLCRRSTSKCAARAHSYTTTDYVRKLMACLSWETVTILTDQRETLVRFEDATIMSELHVINVTAIRADTRSMFTTTSKWESSENILLTGTEAFQLQTIAQMKILSNEEEALSSLVLDTQWLLILDRNVLQQTSTASVRVNNLLIVEQGLENEVLTLWTLHWTSMKQTAPSLAAVRTSAHPSSDVGVASAELYPNAMMTSSQFSRDDTMTSHLYPNVETTSAQLYTDKEGGLRGRTLRIGVMLWHSQMRAKNDNGTTVYSGFCIDLIDILAKALNFNYRLVLPPDDDWGTLIDGSWTGLVGLLANKEVDLTVASLSPTVERALVADWTSLPFDVGDVGFAFVDQRESERLALWTSFLTPFQWPVYACVLGCFLCSGCFLWLLLRLEQRSRDSADPSHPSDYIDNAVLFLFGTLINRATDMGFRPNAARVFVACWCMLGMVLTASYTSQLTSLLADVKPQPLFASLADLVKQDKYRWGIAGGSYVWTSKLKNSSGIQRTFYEKMLTFYQDDRTVFHPDLEEHLKKVLTGYYVYVGLHDTIALWAAEYCEMSTFYDSTTGLPAQGHIFTPKGSALTGRINSVLARVWDSGVLRHLHETSKPSSACFQDEPSSPLSIAIATLQGPCYLLIAGILLSLGALLFERALKRWVT